ncbi:hypothetical protein F4805DRAFT_256134 [Annulohypoxylon moriforme]|nr:hypothetical protein F4805DRAFT_256134 [Annulohypoxylon moriforme]
MATWYVGGTEMSRSSSDSSLPSDGPSRQRRRYIDNRKRRPSYPGISTLPDDFKMFQQLKRDRFVDSHGTFEGVDYDQNSTRPPFFIIKEGNYGLGSPRYDPIIFENTFTAPHYAETQPGVSCEHYRVHQSSDSFDMNRPSQSKDKSHDDAAKLVAAGLADPRRRSRHSQHERILRSLICPKSPEAEFDIDDVALQGIFYAANEIFFQGKLKGRVSWAWMDLPSCLIGTTALRRSPRKPGHETKIFLSRRILKDRKYNRRLLISTFIHELIHSYLFVVCGWPKPECDGHTDGFQTIAKLIDRWAGPDLLYLYNMEAELSHFEEKKEPIFDGWGVPGSHDPVAGGYIMLNPHQCRLRPEIR